MFVREFKDRDKTRAARKALDFWYRRFKDQMILKEFLLQCTWKKEEKEVVITYRGFFPRQKKEKPKKKA